MKTILIIILICVAFLATLYVNYVTYNKIQVMYRDITIVNKNRIERGEQLDKLKQDVTALKEQMARVKDAFDQEKPIPAIK